MFLSPDYRVQLNDPNPVSTTPQLEAVFVGAAPVNPPTAAALQSTATQAATAAAVQLGFAQPLDGSLNDMPLAFSSTAAFASAFPGDTSWLARAVKDYFNAGGLRAWVVRIDSGTTPLLDAIAVGGVGIAMQVPAAGLVLVPDLEALCLASVPPPPPLPTAPPLAPAFRPFAGTVPPPSPAVSNTLSAPAGLAATAIAPSGLTLSWTASTNTGGPGVGGYTVYRDGKLVGTVDGATTRYGDSGLNSNTSYSYTVVAFDSSPAALVSGPSTPLAVSTADPVTPNEVLSRVSAILAAQRPDMLCLFALPVGADGSQSMPKLVTRALDYVGGVSATTPNFPQIQAFAPLLRDAATGSISSPSGLIAGTLAASAETDGVWRSIAGRVLPLGAMPLRRIESNALQQLRAGGVAVLRAAAGGAVLDDDILACVDVPGSAMRRSAGGRRLMGWLLRNLQSFGERLVFENVLDDGRVELILYDLFAALLKRGALNGVQVTDAVKITAVKTSRTTGAGAEWRFDIAVAIALAIERIQLRFVDGELTTTLGAAA
jgi:hypothetical protein